MTQDRSHNYYATSIESRMHSIDDGDISNDLDGPLTRFSRSQHFRSQISKKTVYLRDKVSI